MSFKLNCSKHNPSKFYYVIFTGFFSCNAILQLLTFICILSVRNKFDLSVTIQEKLLNLFFNIPKTIEHVFYPLD